MLHHERLVARTDLKLDRATNTLVGKGLWLDQHAAITDGFIAALARVFKRFMLFIEAEALDRDVLRPTELREGTQKPFLSTEQ